MRVYVDDYTVYRADIISFHADQPLEIDTRADQPLEIDTQAISFYVGNPSEIVN